MIETSSSLIGDFNQPDVDWACLTGDNPTSSLFCNLIFDTNLTQLVTSPTHLKGNILDLVLTNNDHLIEDTTVSQVMEPFPGLKSDHMPITFNI